MHLDIRNVLKSTKTLNQILEQRKVYEVDLILREIFKKELKLRRGVIF